MGGRDSEVSSETTDIFLEVAAFNPRRVRQMRRALSLSTEASYRFERGYRVPRQRLSACSRPSR
jgi:phenylalanyl-tRNA synthetase beta chain